MTWRIRVLLAELPVFHFSETGQTIFDFELIFRQKYHMKKRRIFAKTIVNTRYPR